MILKSTGGGDGGVVVVGCWVVTIGETIFATVFSGILVGFYF
jgi:hypothetical protein